MLPKSTNSDRRIMTSPAPRPSECTATETLLTSLIKVSRNICGYGSKFIGSNKRNANDTIRLVRILLTLFEEIQDRKSKNLPDSVALVLSELNSSFQKILYLLKDCALEGARLLMLMKYELVANRFRVLTRSVVLALDVLPLDAIGVSIEVIEHVELAIKQARRANFEVDREDDEILNEVLLILTLFEVGITPNDIHIRRVLDHIGIEKWSSCNKEVNFLDSEIKFESSMGERELSLLSNLLALMNYSRCTLFDEVDVNCEFRFGTVEPRIEIPNGLSPNDFRCPISFDFMMDPVTVATGHTYDRSSIQNWLRAGNSICPSSGESLKNRDLVPNLALRQIIRQYCLKNSIPLSESSKQIMDLTKKIVAGSSTSEKIAAILAKFLARLLESGTDDEKNRAAFEIKLLSKTTIFNPSCWVEIGLIPNLLKLLRSSNPLTQKNAIVTVMNLSKRLKSKRVIAENRGLEEIVNVLKMGYRVESRQIAAGALFYMASVEEYRKQIGETPEAVSSLMKLLKDVSDGSKKNALVAIYGLLMHPDNHQKVLSAGVVPLLVKLIETSEREILIGDSMEILGTLAEKADGAAEILRSGVLRSVIGFVVSCRSRTGQEIAVCLLVALCIHGGSEVAGVISKSKTLISSLYNLIGEETSSRARWKASALIRVVNVYREFVSDSIDLRHSKNRNQEQIVQAS